MQKYSAIFTAMMFTAAAADSDPCDLDEAGPTVPIPPASPPVNATAHKSPGETHGETSTKHKRKRKRLTAPTSEKPFAQGPELAGGNQGTMILNRALFSTETDADKRCEQTKDVAACTTNLDDQLNQACTWDFQKKECRAMPAISTLDQKEWCKKGDDCSCFSLDCSGRPGNTDVFCYGEDFDDNNKLCKTCMSAHTDNDFTLCKVQDHADWTPGGTMMLLRSTMGGDDDAHCQSLKTLKDCVSDPAGVWVSYPPVFRHTCSWDFQQSKCRQWDPSQAKTCPDGMKEADRSDCGCYSVDCHALPGDTTVYCYQGDGVTVASYKANDDKCNNCLNDGGKYNPWPLQCPV